jgi:hypothetical protein
MREERGARTARALSARMRPLRALKATMELFG